MLGRTLAVVLSMLLLSSAAADAERYLWTLSASDTDPYANVAEPSLGIFEIHLWLALDPTGQGGSVCILPCPATGANYTVDCSAMPEAHPNAWIGFSNNGTPPCSGGECGPISVSNESWGRVKSLYQ
jgi:hypothetical protein